MCLPATQEEQQQKEKNHQNHLRSQTCPQTLGMNLDHVKSGEFDSHTRNFMAFLRNRQHRRSKNIKIWHQNSCSFLGGVLSRPSTYNCIRYATSICSTHRTAPVPWSIQVSLASKGSQCRCPKGPVSTLQIVPGCAQKLQIGHLWKQKQTTKHNKTPQNNIPLNLVSECFRSAMFDRISLSSCQKPHQNPHNFPTTFQIFPVPASWSSYFTCNSPCRSRGELLAAFGFQCSSARISKVSATRAARRQRMAMKRNGPQNG